MERRNWQALFVALLALVAIVAIGCGDDDQEGDSGAGAPTTQTAPGPADDADDGPDVESCIDRWNGENEQPQAYARNLRNRLRDGDADDPVSAHVGRTTDKPPRCSVTLIANDGSAYVFGGGGGTTFPYAPTPTETTRERLPSADRKPNAVVDDEGMLAAR